MSAAFPDSSFFICRTDPARQASPERQAYFRATTQTSPRFIPAKTLRRNGCGGARLPASVHTRSRQLSTGRYRFPLLINCRASRPASVTRIRLAWSTNSRSIVRRDGSPYEPGALFAAHAWRHVAKSGKSSTTFETLDLAQTYGRGAGLSVSDHASSQ